MTSVRRSEASSFSAVSNEPEVPAAPTSKPALKAVSRPSSNQVESHPAPQSAARPIDADLVNASTDLIKGYVHPGIFESNRPDLAQKELSKLPAREFSAVLGKLEQSGTLERFVGQLSPEQRTAFLDTAVRKGALQRQAGHPVGGPLQPPAMPSTYSIPQSAPLALAQAANQSNHDAAGSFYGAQQAYFDRYEAAAKACTSGAGLRAMGPPARVEFVPDGISASHPRSNQLSAEWLGAHRFPSDARLHKAVSDKLSDFIGEARAGSVFVEGKVEVDAVSKKVSLEASGRIDESGKAEGKAGGKVKLPNGFLVGLDSKGTTTVGVHGGGASVAMKGDKVAVAITSDDPHSKLKPKFELETTAGGRITKLKAQLVGSGVTYEKGRGQIDASIPAKDCAGGYAFYDSAKAEFGGGMKATLKSGEDSITLQAALGMQGLSEANARHGLNGVGVWNTPPELISGKEWKELGPKAHDTYRRLGWTEQEWTTRVNGRG